MSGFYLVPETRWSRFTDRLRRCRQFVQCLYLIHSPKCMKCWRRRYAAGMCRKHYDEEEAKTAALMARLEQSLGKLPPMEPMYFEVIGPTLMGKTIRVKIR